MLICDGVLFGGREQTGLAWLAETGARHERLRQVGQGRPGERLASEELHLRDGFVPTAGNMQLTNQGHGANK